MTRHDVSRTEGYRGFAVTDGGRGICGATMRTAVQRAPQAATRPSTARTATIPIELIATTERPVRRGLGSLVPGPSEWRSALQSAGPAGRSQPWPAATSAAGNVSV